MKSRIDKLEYSFIIDKYNNKYYYKNNERHREKDLPAEIWKHGSRLWWKNGKKHRDNGSPSSIYPDGRMAWWENGILIRTSYQ